MRIRKRHAQVPFPPTAGEEDLPRPSDQPNQHLSPIGNWVSSGATGSPKDKESIKREEEREDDKRSNDSRNENILGATTEVTGVTLPLSSSSKEGERAFPLKKRRGSFEGRPSSETTMEKDKTANMKTKMNKKCEEKSNNHLQDDKETVGTEENMNKKVRKRARGGVLMEGSRCSRVNGRGWRCCQQTLVGYSLCEHHLGKGRIRNITSVRSRGIGTIVIAPEKKTLEEIQGENSLVNNGGKDDEEYDEKPLIMTKKKTKLGTVKARSLSSLLGQINSGVQQHMTASEKNDD